MYVRSIVIDAADNTRGRRATKSLPIVALVLRIHHFMTGIEVHRGRNGRIASISAACDMIISKTCHKQRPKISFSFLGSCL